jgi:hypothetical protein
MGVFGMLCNQWCLAFLVDLLKERWGGEIRRNVSTACQVHSRYGS